MKSIVIYAGKGISSNCLNQLISAFKYVSMNPKLVDAPFFLSPKWQQKTSLVVLPGGRDLLYHEQLKGKANQSIRQYVEEGGAYLGICAGGYYGAREIEFEKGNELEVVGKRELQFYPGKAIGPAYGNGLFKYDTECGARAALISWNKEEAAVYFNGGCFFENPYLYPHIKVLGVYKDIFENPAAIIECLIGEGKAILSGVHPEYSPPLWTYLLSLIIS